MARSSPLLAAAPPLVGGVLAIALDAAMGSSWAACVGAGVALLLAAATTPLGPGLSLAGLAAGA
ncbi:MAG TPA: hypothetical protein RMG45_30020, partial [Polyangiaceae bacterium LLY-WYZ-15_(1-7)]|nr:hypothetical protein [Polyangiaceae bacterium LLY-WYZ-15_(1-7)]